MRHQNASYKNDQDAFGHMIQDDYNGNQPFEIIEREDGYIDASDHVGFYFHEYQDWPPFELHLAYHAYNRERGRMSGQIRMRVCYKVWRSSWFDYLMVSKAELEEILFGTGWWIKEYINRPDRGILRL